MVFFKNRTIGIDPPNFNRWVFLFEIFGNTRYCSASAYTNDKMCDFTISLFPYFGTGLFIVSNRIGGVVVLVDIPSIGCFFSDTLRSRIVRTWVIGWHIGWTNNHISAHSTKHIKFGWGLFVIRYANQFISLNNGGKC